MRPTCPHRHTIPPDTRSITKRLASAEAHCAAAGAQWTPSRARTYELLVRSEGPVKAYDLLAAYGPSRGSAKPPTIYRALDFLVGLGLVHRLEIGNLFVACSRSSAPHNAQILICDCCARAFELELGAGAIIERAARQAGYALSGWRAEAAGLCPTCH